jgi:hypothetical protein
VDLTKALDAEPGLLMNERSIIEMRGFGNNNTAPWVAVLTGFTPITEVVCEWYVAVGKGKGSGT